MRVLYVIDSLGGGGAERSLAALAPHYAARGVELEVAHLNGGDVVRAELEAAGVRLFDLSGPAGVWGGSAGRPVWRGRAGPTCCTRPCSRPTCGVAPRGRSHACRSCRAS